MIATNRQQNSKLTIMFRVKWSGVFVFFNGAVHLVAEDTLQVPKNLDEAKELVNKLSIEHLWAFCFTFGSLQD